MDEAPEVLMVLTVGARELMERDVMDVITEGLGRPDFDWRVGL